MALPSACAPASRSAVQKPFLRNTRTDPRWAAYTASGRWSMATVMRSARVESIATSTGRVSDSGSLLHRRLRRRSPPGR
jgi:hypothetical protein